MRPDELREARRIVVVRLDNVGDVLLTAPLARALRDAAPAARLTLLASPAGATAAPLLPWYDDVIVHRAPWQDVGDRLGFDPDHERAFVDGLAARSFDAAFICTSFSQTPWPAAYACYLAGIPIRVGHGDLFGGSVLTTAVTAPPDGTHQAERNLALLDGLRITVADRGPAVDVPNVARRSAAALLAAAGIAAGTPVALVPGASCAARRWHPERYAAVARALADRGHRIVVLGTAREAPLAKPIVAACPSAVSLVGRTDVAEFAALIEQSALVICGNSSALHLADALDIPVVALYSGTDRESEWAPRRTRHTLLRVETACSPCRLFDCPIGLACLDLPAEAVVTAAEDLLGRLPPSTTRTEEPCAVSAS